MLYLVCWLLQSAPVRVTRYCTHVKVFISKKIAGGLNIKFFWWNLAQSFLLHVYKRISTIFIWNLCLKSFFYPPPQKKKLFWFLKKTTPKNISLCFPSNSVLKTINTHIYLFCIFENTHKKLFWLFLKINNFFSCILKNTDQNNICVPIVFKSKTNKNMKNNFFNVFISKFKNALDFLGSPNLKKPFLCFSF